MSLSRGAGCSPGRVARGARAGRGRSADTADRLRLLRAEAGNTRFRGPVSARLGDCPAHGRRHAVGEHCGQRLVGTGDGGLRRTLRRGDLGSPAVGGQPGPSPAVTEVRLEAGIQVVPVPDAAVKKFALRGQGRSPVRERTGTGPRLRGAACRHGRRSRRPPAAWHRRGGVGRTAGAVQRPVPLHVQATRRSAGAQTDGPQRPAEPPRPVRHRQRQSRPAPPPTTGRRRRRTIPAEEQEASLQQRNSASISGSPEAPKPRR